MAPALRIPLSLNMGEFDKNIEKAKTSTAGATKFIAKQFIDMNASLLATQGAAGGVVLAFRSILGALGPLSIAIAGIVGVFKLMGYATELAKEKIEEFNEMAASAAKANVSTDFFQRFVKSGEALKLTIEEVSMALERFNAVSTDKLGGGELAKRIAELKEAGNFSGNTGVDAMGGTDTEAKMRATVQLIDEALNKGERLAALDIAEKAFGPKLAANLRQNSSYLTDMLATMDKMAASKLVSEQQVGEAIKLKNEMEAAQKILAERFKPIQDDLAKLGTQYHASWVDITKQLANAVEQANFLYDAIKKIPGIMAELGNASFWTKLTNVSEKLGLNSSRPEGMVLKGEPGFMETPGNAALAAGLNNPNAMRKQMQEAVDVQSKVRGDTSIAPTAKALSDVSNEYDRAIKTIERHTERMKADKDAVGLGAGALEEYRAKYSLMLAAKTAGIPVIGETARKIDEIAKAAKTAGEELAKAKVNSEIQFGAKTAFLSQEDVAIANQLKSIYGNDIPAAMASSQAAAMRLNEATRSVASVISNNLTTSIVDVIDGTKSAGDAFKDFSKIAIRAINEAIVKMLVVGPLMRSLQGGLGGLFGGTIDIPKFAGGTNSAPGGLAIVGERGPELINLRKGAQVIPNEVLQGSGSGQVNVTYAPSYVMQGTAEEIQRLRLEAANDREQFSSKVVATVQKARSSRIL